MKKNLNSILRVLATICISIVSAILFGIYSNYVFAFSILVIICIAFFIFKIVSTKKCKENLKNIVCSIIILIAANHLYDYDKLISVFPFIKTIGKDSFLIILFVSLILLVIVYGIFNYINQGIDTQKNVTMPNNYKNFFGSEKSVSGNTNRSFNSESNTQTTDTSIPGNLNNVYDLNYRRDSSIPYKTKEERKNDVKKTFKTIGIIAGIILIVGVSFFVYYDTDIVNKIKTIDGIKDLGVWISSLLGYGSTFIFFLFSLAIVIIVLIEVIKFIIARIKSFKQDITRTKNESLIYAISISIVISLVLFAFGITDFTVDSLNDIIVKSNYLALPIFVIIVIVTAIVLVKITVAVIKEITTANFSQFIKSEIPTFKKSIKQIFELLIDIIFGGIETILSFLKFIPDFFTNMLELIKTDEIEETDETDEVTNGSKEEN